MEIYETLDENYIKYGKTKIRVITDNNDDLWFAAKNTTTALGYIDGKSALDAHVKPRDITQLRNINYDNKIGHPQTLYINEAGLYRLMLRSKMPKAELFTDWVTQEVLPSIRKYGSYKLKKEYEKTVKDLTKKLKYVKKQRDEFEKDIQHEIYPDGALVYAIDYSSENNGKKTYRIGMTGNMKLRKKIYNTHTLHNHKVVFMVETKTPYKLETCIRAMLYDYRYKPVKKDFYICTLDRIKTAFKTCISSLKHMDNKKKSGSKRNQTGGTSNLFFNRQINLLETKKTTLKTKINKINNKLY